MLLKVILATTTVIRLRRIQSKETNIDEVFFEDNKSKETSVQVTGESKETNIDDVTGHTSSRSSLTTDRRNSGW